MKKSKKIFKIIADAPAMLERLHELTGNELKVWMYFWLRTASEGTAFPGNKTIARELKIDIDTVKSAKRGLRAKGWTSKKDQRRREDGTMSTVVEKIHMPWGKTATKEEEKYPHGTVGGKTGDGKFPQQKEYSIKPEVPPSPSAPAYSELLEVGVSESVSELVSEAAPPPPSWLPSQAPTPETQTPQAGEAKTKEKTKTEPRSQHADLNPAAMTVVRNMYPGWIPSDLGVDAEELNSVAAQQSDSGLDWNEFFVWHRAHKPPKLIFRDAARFLAGWEYAVNDYAAHHPKTCAVCLKLGKQQQHPHAPFIRCDGCGGDASPKYKDEDFCENCYPKYSRAAAGLPLIAEKPCGCGDKRGEGHTGFCTEEAE